MPNLEDLPNELLAAIIKEVILAEREPPPQIVPGLDRAERLGPARIKCVARPDVWYETVQKAYRTTAYGLLCTSKKLKAETDEVLKKVSAIYKLDVGFNGRALLPTWTYLPKKTNNIELLKATFGAKGPGYDCFAKFLDPHEGVKSVDWMLHELFQMFMEFSVQGSKEEPGGFG